MYKHKNKILYTLGKYNKHKSYSRQKSFVITPMLILTGGSAVGLVALLTVVCHDWVPSNIRDAG